MPSTSSNRSTNPSLSGWESKVNSIGGAPTLGGGGGAPLGVPNLTTTPYGTGGGFSGGMFNSAGIPNLSVTMPGLGGNFAPNRTDMMPGAPYQLPGMPFTQPGAGQPANSIPGVMADGGPGGQYRQPTPQHDPWQGMETWLSQLPPQFRQIFDQARQNPNFFGEPYQIQG